MQKIEILLIFVAMKIYEICNFESRIVYGQIQVFGPLPCIVEKNEVTQEML